MTTPRLGADEIATLERLHQPDDEHDGCIWCPGPEWPCPTSRLLTERREREAQLAKVRELLDEDGRGYDPENPISVLVGKIDEALADKGTPHE